MAHTTTARLTRRLALVVLALLSLSACREQVSEKPPIHLNPNMDDQAYIESQEGNPFSQSGRQLQPVRHTVAAGTTGYGPRSTVVDGILANHFTRYDEDWLAHGPNQNPNRRTRGAGSFDASFYTGYDPGTPDGRSCTSDKDCGGDIPMFCDTSQRTPTCAQKDFDDGLPEMLTTALRSDDALRSFLSRGQARFNIYCTPCHGANGGAVGGAGPQGAGIVKIRVPSWNIPSYHTDKARAYPLGRIYDIVTNGQGKMPSYAAQIPVVDRWAIVSYVRALQQSRHAANNQAPKNPR